MRTALLVAAGAGRRMQPLTDDRPKCLVEVAGVSMLDRLVAALLANGFSRLVVVLGYRRDQVERALSAHRELDVDVVYNDDYDRTNSLYSLQLGLQRIREPFVLFESDIVFPASLLQRLMARVVESAMLVNPPSPALQGTLAMVDDGYVTHVYHADDQSGDLDLSNGHKTLNISAFSSSAALAFRGAADQAIKQFGRQSPLERALQRFVAGPRAVEAVLVEDECWAELDTAEELRAFEGLLQPTSGL